MVVLRRAVEHEEQEHPGKACLAGQLVAAACLDVVLQASSEDFSAAVEAERPTFAPLLVRVAHPLKLPLLQVGP